MSAYALNNNSISQLTAPNL